jgi:hypothetical protein
MAWGKKESGGGCLARLALLVAILALILAWVAYRRTGGEIGGLFKDLTESATVQVRGTVEDGAEAAGRQGDLARARARLLGRKAEVETDSNLQQVRDDVLRVREDLESAYEGAGAEAERRWRVLDAELGKLEGQLREGSAKAKDTLDGVLDKLRSEERNDRNDRNDQDGGDDAGR